MGADACDEDDESRLLLEEAVDLVPEVAAASGRARFCMARWSMASARLEQLRELLVDVPQRGNARLCATVMAPTIASLRAAMELARECDSKESIENVGKLQMQSRIDAIITSLDGHIRDCRLLLGGGGTVLTAAGSGAVTAVNGKRAFVRDLLSRLQIGGGEQRAAAMNALTEFMADDAKNVLVVAASHGAVTALVTALDGAGTAVTAAAALADIAVVAPATVVADGAVAPLVRLLGAGGAVSEAAARALQTVTAIATGGENARLVAAHGGAAALVALASSGTPASQAAAAGVLRNLSTVEEIRRRILDEDHALGVLVTLVTSGTPASRENAAATLLNLATGNPEVRRCVLCDHVEALVRHLDHADDPASQEVGLASICSLVDSDASVQALVDAGFIHQVCKFLSNGATSVQTVASMAVVKLGGYSLHAKRVMADAGCVPHLVRIMVDGKTRDARVTAIQALVTLMDVESVKKAFVLDDKGISGMVALLEEDEGVESSSPSPQLQHPRMVNPVRRRNAGAELAVTGLLMVAGSSRCRKQMVACGALHRLNRLTRLDVAGSRRLMERLHAGGGSTIGGGNGGGNMIRNLLKKL